MTAILLYFCQQFSNVWQWCLSWHNHLFRIDIPTTESTWIKHLSGGNLSAGAPRTVLGLYGASDVIGYCVHWKVRESKTYKSDRVSYLSFAIDIKHPSSANTLEDTNEWSNHLWFLNSGYIRFIYS